MDPEPTSIFYADLAGALLANPLFQHDLLILSRTENSDLLDVSKECSREFFEKLFEANGPLWQTYANTRTGYAPTSSRHLNFVAGRMYFCKNVEKRFIRFQGREKKFELIDGILTEKTFLSPDDLVLFASTPFDSLAQIFDVALLPIYVNEKLRQFPAFRDASIEFLELSESVSLESASKFAKEALARAVSSMEFSFVSSLALAFGTRIADSLVWKECDEEKMFGDCLKNGAI